LVNGIEIIRTDRQPPSSNETDGVSRIDLSSTNATGPTTVDNGDIAWGQARGAFMVGNKVFYGATDNLLHSRTYNGATWGPDVKYNLYHDPAWANVRTGDGTSTFDGAYPSLYGEMPNVTGMFYLDGRLYYTEFGDSRLRSRWFSPDSGIVDETSVQAPSSVNFSDADGMFYANGKLYYVTASDGALHAVNFANGAVTGSPSTVSSPSTDGIDWRNRAMFLFNGSPVGAPNHAPAAAFSSDCKVNACDFDGSGSTDSDGSIASYAWDFGDGQSGTGAKPSHTYSAAGTYTVKLTVTDNDGATDSVSHGVTVTDPAPSAVSYVGADHSPAGSTLFKTVKVPATAAAGDTMLVFATGNTSGNPAGPSGVSGLQQLDSFTNGQVVSTVWKKTLAAGDPGATLRMDYAQYEKATLSVVVYSGVDGSKLDATDLAHSGDVSTDQHTSATVNASAGEWVVTYWADKSPSTDTWTAPAGVTQRDTGVDTGSGRFGMLLADSGGPVPAGQYGNLTATTNAASNRALMWTIRLTPA
jgi:PKD repeat protein